MPKYLIYTYNTQPWKTNEKFLVVAPRHIKTGTNEEIKTATQISYCISLIICHTTSLLCHTSSSSTNSLNFYINSWSNLTPHNASTVTMPQTMFHPVYKILPPIFILTCDYALILNPFTFLEKFFRRVEEKFDISSISYLIWVLNGSLCWTLLPVLKRKNILKGRFSIIRYYNMLTPY